MKRKNARIGWELAPKKRDVFGTPRGPLGDPLGTPWAPLGAPLGPLGPPWDAPGALRAFFFDVSGNIAESVTQNRHPRRFFRFPHNFKSLMELVKKYNLGKNYFYLGTVPYIDVMSLIFHSTAVINPSLFEGWSSTVEQAKAYKKKIILSNIRVHKEQKPRFAYYFRPENFIDLSKILMKLKLSKNSKIINSYEDDMDKKMENYIKEYYKILK